MFDNPYSLDSEEAEKDQNHTPDLCLCVWACSGQEQASGGQTGMDAV